MELARGARGGVVMLVKAHVARIVDEEAGRKEGGDAFSIEDQRAVSVTERRDRRGLPAVAPLGDIPDVGSVGVFSRKGARGPSRCGVGRSSARDRDSRFSLLRRASASDKTSKAKDNSLFERDTRGHTRVFGKRTGYH